MELIEADLPTGRIGANEETLMNWYSDTIDYLILIYVHLLKFTLTKRLNYMKFIKTYIELMMFKSLLI